MKLTEMVTLALSLTLALNPLAEAKSKRKPNAAGDRPPQFVLLAFDGSLALDFWQESLDFADTVKTDGGKRNIRFTYFVNPPYFINADKKSAYKTPGLGKAVSCIGWSNGPETIGPRVAFTNKAFKTGHEIGSHANSHCDASGVDRDNPLYGHKYGEEEWTSEFEQFNHLLFNAFAINGTKPVVPFEYGKRDIVGFRAPLLAYTDGLWPTLQKFGFRYDTSRSSQPTYWPEKNKWGTWNFPLGEIKVAGGGKTTLSMDYNWLCRQSACVTKPGLTEEQRQAFKKQVLDSYKYYFKINYFGGRGPVHIGHHFSKWNKGAYWEAMQDFAKFVCNKPEVRCVTYKEYADWLDGLNPAEYQAYRSGKFDKMPNDGTIHDIATPILADIQLKTDDGAFAAFVPEKDQAKMKAGGWKTQLQVDFKPQPSNKITKEDLGKIVQPGSTVFIRASLLNRSGAELDSDTYRIDKFGTPEEKIFESLEKKAMMGETPDAHTTPE